MDVVQDEDAEGTGEDEDGKEAQGEVRSPVRLRGRGGFTHPRGTRGSGRGRGRGRGEAPPPSTAAQPPSQPAVRTKTAADPMDSLTSSMSALKFVPHSLYSRGGRGRGRGG